MIKKDWLLTSYDYSLPEDLIASRPKKVRHLSKLFYFNSKYNTKEHLVFKNFIDLLPQDSLLVFNNSKVFPARLNGFKGSKEGGRCEVLLLSPVAINEDSNEEGLIFPCMIKMSGKKRSGQEILFPVDSHERKFLKGKIVDYSLADHFYIQFLGEKATDLYKILHHIGKVPIPPYIRKGMSDEADIHSYQTVYAKEEGSVAAPTAGLHFSQEMLTHLKEKNIEMAHVCLHVGPGTFSPVRSENITEHNMHKEFFSIAKEEVQKITKAIRNNKKVVAIGTTSLRVLESCKTLTGDFSYEKFLTSNEDVEGYTDLFLYPDSSTSQNWIVQGLITNFHLPKSSLLMLVSSFMGREKMLSLYNEAIEKKYYFYSYGDAMYLDRGHP